MGRPKGSKNRPKILASDYQGAPSVRTARKTDHLFKPGVSPNPAGRPKGSRNKLSESFISALHNSFERNGPDVIEEVKADSPVEYLKLISSIVPKQFGLEEGTGDVFLKLWQAISDGKTV